MTMLINPFWSAPSAPFSPSDVSGLTLWLKADAITGKSDGDLLDQWDDLSGNAFHATASGALRPTYKTNIENGNPAVLFSGAQRMDTTGYSNLVAAANSAAFAVVRLTDYSLASSQAIIFESSFSRWGLSFNTSGVGRGTIFTTGTVSRGTGAATDGVITLLDMRHDSSLGSSGLQVKTLGSALDQQAVANQTFNANLAQIGGVSGVSRPATGYFFEIITYNSALSDTDRTNLRNYLATEWGFVYS